MAPKTPAWWYNKKGVGAPWWRPLLWPISALWVMVGRYKARHTKPYRSSLFVISIGNLTVGGSGKTPIALALLNLLHGSGQKAAGLSKGYGGSEVGPLWVDASKHQADQVGDEALLVGQYNPMMIAKDRALGLKSIEASPHKIAIIDDAHQNHTIHKDRHVLVVDGDTQNGQWPFGDGSIIPCGPMREDFKDGLARADLVVLYLPDSQVSPDPELMTLLQSRPLAIARLCVKDADPRRVIAYAGIAKPWKFEATLRQQGYEIAGFHAFADHAALSEAQLNALMIDAKHKDAQLITTQKDWVKLEAKWRDVIHPFTITAQFDDPDFVLKALGIDTAQSAAEAISER